MRKFAAIIGANESIIEKARAIIDSRNMFLKYIVFSEINYAVLNEVNCIFIDDNLLSQNKNEIITFCLQNNKELFAMPNLVEIGKPNKYHKVKDMLVFKLDDFHLTKPQIFFKRLFDIIVSLIVIILLSPLMMLIYILIKIFDPGPALYLQKRLTINKKSFILFKFRTMIVKAEKYSGVVLSSENDNRITKIGKFLRQTRLDEIPQIFNVLIGDMSLVGPRPERRYFVNQFSQENPYYDYRFRVKAGITGLAQINCRYNSKYYDKLRFDLLYISRYSFLNDILIILKTIKIIFDKDATEGTKEESFEDLLKRYQIQTYQIEPGILELRKNYEKNSIQL